MDHAVTFSYSIRAIRIVCGILCACLCGRVALRSQSAVPKQEVRAVWVATVLGLDWPKSEDRAEQERSLREIVRRLSAAHFNTIFFQVRGRADAMYRSQYEPWSPQLTGTLGKDPGWDPLAVILEEAHAHCMEVHAWFNTIMVKNGGGPPSESIPLHLILAHPEWIHEVDGELWLDPGLPEVREYLVRVAMDIVRHYDIDGFQFDFLRYPAQEFPDQETYRRYGKAMPKDQWRRENINAIAKTFHDSACAVKPKLKIGSSPIGIYQNTARIRGLQSYSELFQDSRLWLREGWQDYLTPQVYWPLGPSPGDPDVSLLLKDWADWVANMHGRHLYAGIGAYKPAVFPEMPQIIDLTRSAGLEGNSFFRYSNIENALMLGNRYPTPAFIPPMRWKDSIPPEPPKNVRVRAISDGIVSVSWDPSPVAPDGDSARGYVVYRSHEKETDRSRPENIEAILPPANREFRDTVQGKVSAGYYYCVTAIDRLWNESGPGKEFEPTPVLAELARAYLAALVVKKPYRPPGSTVVYFPFELPEVAPVILKILDDRNREVVSVVDAVELPGRYIASADVSKLSAGSYSSLYVIGDRSIKLSFEIR